MSQYENDDFGRHYARQDTLDDVDDSSKWNASNMGPSQRSDKANANLLSSLADDGKHYPVIDIDIPCRFIPSSTLGHGHLYFDVPLEWHEYRVMLYYMMKAGIVQKGYYHASVARNQSYVRPPWVKKKSNQAQVHTQTPAKQINQWNTNCHKCGAPAYQGFMSTTCSKGCT